MASKGRVLRPQGALMVFPCMGSLTQVTIWPARRTALIRWGSFTLMFSAPILVITVILPALFWGLKISISFTSSLGSILSLTCIQTPMGQFFSSDMQYPIPIIHIKFKSSNSFISESHLTGHVRSIWDWLHESKINQVHISHLSNSGVWK